MSAAKLDKEFYSIEEIADLLGVRYQLIYRLVRDGELPASRIGRIYRISRQDIEEYLARSRTAPAPAFTCPACGKSYASHTSGKGECETCGKPICFDCWTRKEIRSCTDHGKKA